MTLGRLNLHFMKRFITRLLSFGTITVVIFSILYTVSSICNDFSYRQLYNGYDTLILGDSHVRFLNEQILPKSLNLYRGGQSYKESYFKLRYFDRINDFDHLILATSFHNFSSLAEYKINEDYHSVHSISTICNPLQLFESTRSLDAFTKVLFGSFASVKLNLLVAVIQGKHPSTLKSELDVDVQYSTLDALRKKKKHLPKLSKLEGRIDHHYFYEGSHNYISPASIQYFDKIVDYCQKNSIELLLVNMPLHPQYLSEIPNFYKIQLKKQIANSVGLDNVHYIDYTKEFRKTPSMFSDQDHCSPLGGALISDKLKKEFSL